MFHHRSRIVVIAAAMLACHGDSGGDAPDDEGSTDDSSSSEASTDSGESSDGTTTGMADSESSGTTGELPPCPDFAPGTMVATVTDPEIVETSGIAVSRMHAGVLWVHNDSGDGPRVFAIDDTGTTLGEFSLNGAIALDWEDMALGPGPEPGVDYLYVGDIGDNPELRATITVHRVPEPDPASGGSTLEGVVPLVLAYPDDSHDAETLLSDPETGDLFVVTKADSGMSGVYRAAFPHDEHATIEMELVAELAFGSTALPGSPLATGGDVAPDGSLVAIRTYGGAFAWRRAPGSTIAEAFATDACPLPTVDEPQGEALAVAADGYYTITEGEMPPLWFFASL